MRIFAPSTFLAVCSITAVTGVALAQQGDRAADGDAMTRVAMAIRTSAPDSARRPEIILSSVTSSGAPRSYQVVSIPVPEMFANAPEIDVEITARGQFVVLGSGVRKLGEPRTRKSRLTITIGIPASSLAGKLIAAEARFSAASVGTLVVPVEMEVALVRDLVIRTGAAPLTGHAGTDIVVPFEIVNRGNAKETVHAELDLPSGWPTRGQKSSAIVIEPGASIKRRARVAIPALSSTGSSFVRVDLREGSAILGSSTIRIEVSNAASIGRDAGPRFVSAISHTSDELGRPSRLATFHANGALFDSVRVDARMSHGSQLGGAASNALSRLGTFPTPPSLVLSSSQGQLSVGNTGTSFSDLTGLYPYGQGALLHLEKPTWGFTALGARSIATLGSGKAQPMFGVSANRLVGEFRASASISHLSDGAASPRKLDAVGVGGSAPSLFGSTLNAEVAHRRFLSGSGFGWSAGMIRSQPESDQQLMFTHAPGGSDAFARATDEVILRLMERFTPRASVSGSAWRTSDETAVFSNLNSNGFSLRPQYEVLRNTTLSLELRSYLFDATTRQGSTSAGGAFGNREQQFGIGLSTSLRQFYVFSSAYLGTVTRTVTPMGQQTLTDRTPRNYWATNAGWSGVGGKIEIQTRIEQTRDAAGFVNQQNLYGIRAEQVVLPALGGVQAEGEVQRVNGFGDEHSTIMRAGFAVPLVQGFAFKINVERNSIFRSITGRAPWIFAARFEHTLALPMVRKPGVSGYVFQDLNGNLQRDRDELGVPGAIVRRGAESAVADNGGKFRVGGDPGQPIVLDEASLPEGWIATGARDGNLAISLSASAEIHLVVASRPGIAEAELDLGKARVIARDSAGREWSARMNGSATAVFDALPVGTYTLVFDLSELSEPLVPRSPLPILVINSREPRSVTVTLDPRPIRMWQPPSATHRAPKTGASSSNAKSP
jgi:hypothetical protein